MILLCLALFCEQQNVSYLDDIALRNASYAYSKWKHIILANRILRKRLNTFELGIVLGSKNLVPFYKRKKKKKRMEGNSRNYLMKGVCADKTMKITVIKSKRSGEDIILHTKRFRLY